MLPTFQDIEAARRRIAGAVAVTPCPESVALSELTGCRIFCKLEYLQRTGSFKERGARNALLLLSAEQRRRGVIAASAGNHALGLSYHGKLLGIPVTVVMPRFAPLTKRATCRQLGARVILEGNSFAEARARADELVASEQLTYVHGYDDPAIIAGQGTLGLEVMEQVPDADAVVVPIGGAGLIAGVSLAIKTVKPQVKVIGVEPTHAGCYQAALEAGTPVSIACQPTLADGLAVNLVGANAFELARRHINRVVSVTEVDLARAILRLLELEKSVVEGAGAAPLAALLSGQLTELAGKTVVLLLCGGNIDPVVLTRVIDKGMVADGRLCRFTAVISDRPGGLAEFATRVAATGASIKDVAHDRAFSGPDVWAVQVLCTAETNDPEHIGQLLEALREFHPRLLTGV
ncbi:MAG: threonine ammonia-lyase [Phycisphaeraceae bacterium]